MYATVVWLSVGDYFVAKNYLKEKLGGNWYHNHTSWPNTDRRRREQLLGITMTTKDSAQKVADCLRESGYTIQFDPDS